MSLVYHIGNAVPIRNATWVTWGNLNFVCPIRKAVRSVLGHKGSKIGLGQYKSLALNSSSFMIAEVSQILLPHP